MKPYYSDDQATIYHADCREVLALVGPVDAVVTSPPYAQQRQVQYGGVPEVDYPAFTSDWMSRLHGLRHDGSVLINIREHIQDGEMSDYVHRTRGRVRADGWVEIDELLWIKPDGLPVGHPSRPRRSWERVLWFSPSPQPRCFPKANGRKSSRLGLSGVAGGPSASWVASESDGVSEGVARVPDYCVVSVRDRPDGIDHPAVFPPPVARWLTQLVAVPGDVVLDPFMGSGTTLVAAKYGGYRAIGIEVEERYCEIAVRRLGQEVLDFGEAA